MEAAAEQRHTAVRSAARWLDLNPSLPAPQAAVAQVFARAAMDLLDLVPDGPELTKALDALIQAKDHGVRASLAASRPW